MKLLASKDELTSKSVKLLVPVLLTSILFHYSVILKIGFRWF